MAITLSNAAAKAMADALVDLVDAGGAGTLTLHESDNTEVASLALSATAFGAATTASPAVATAAAITDDSDADGGDLSGGYHRFNNNAGTEVWRGSVGTSGADLNLSTLTIGAGAVVSCSSYTVSQPTS